MNWVLRRVGALILAMLAGALVGYVLGSMVRAPVLAALAGGACGVAVVAVRDALRAARLIGWLTGGHESPAPRSKDVWGEVGYRIERLVRAQERKAAEGQNRLTQFLTAIEASPNGVMMLDADDQITWCNSVAADHFGLHPRRDLHQRVTNLVRAPAFVAYLQAGRYDEPVKFVDSRGRATLSVLLRPYGDGLKLMLSLDVTEAERAEAMRRDFVANVSHEMRTPLTVLAGFVETLTNLPLSSAERTRVLELMRQQTARMQTLVADLLTLAQLEASPRPSADRWVSVGDLLAHVEADARALSAGRHRLTVQSESAVQIAGGQAELLSAIGNLVNNAVRYTPEQGEIDVRWSIRGDGSGVVEVRDSGVGIAPEHIPRVTERFYRVDSSRSRETGGTGLGLSIVKHVMQRHGGALEIASEPGKGSCFRLVFPAVRVRQREAAAPAAGATAVEGAATRL